MSGTWPGLCGVRRSYSDLTPMAGPAATQALLVGVAMELCMLASAKRHLHMHKTQVQPCICLWLVTWYSAMPTTPTRGGHYLPRETRRNIMASYRTYLGRLLPQCHGMAMRRGSHPPGRPLRSTARLLNARRDGYPALARLQSQRNVRQPQSGRSGYMFCIGNRQKHPDKAPQRGPFLLAQRFQPERWTQPSRWKVRRWR